MIFLTNRPINILKNTNCKISGYSFDEIDSLKIPQQVVLDVSNEYPVRTLQNLIRHFNCQFINAPMELTSHNTVYFVQDGQRNIVKIEVL